jgi:hypothetical protein
MTVDRRTVVLGLTAAAAVAAAVTVTVWNHSSGQSKERKSVSAYITQVNDVQNRMHAPLTRVMLAYRDFTSKGAATQKASAAELGAAAASLERLERRLAAIPAPPQARHLRRLLLALVREQVAITHEVRLMATFTPQFTRVLAEAHVANTALGKALAAISVPKPHRLRGTKKKVLAAQRAYQAQASAAATAQADAVDAYDRRIETVVARLRTLHPPLVFAPEVRAQMSALRQTVAAGSRLATQLRQSNRRDVAVLGRRFTIASRQAQSVAAQRAEIAAIRAYNARARSVGAAAGRVQTELLRLQKSLP